MPITLMTPPTPGAPIDLNDYNNLNAIAQQLVNGIPVDKYLLTEWFTLDEPEIAQGQRIQHGGSLYEVDTADEVIVGAPADGLVYIKLTPTGGGATLTASFVTSLAGYAWNDIYQGFYHADNSQILPYILVKENTDEWKKFYFFDYRMHGQSSMATVMVYPFFSMNSIYQDDSKDCIPIPAGYMHFNFSSPNLINSNGDIPTNMTDIKFLDSDDASALFANRGVLFNGAGYVVYNYTWGNAGAIKLRIKPNWAFNVAAAVWILECDPTPAGGQNYLYLAYNATSDKLEFHVADDAGNYITINSNQFLNNPALQIWMDIVITWDKNNNEDADGKGNAKMFINGVEMDGVGAGTKTKNGTGISALNMASTELFIGCRYTYTNIGTAYFTDWIFGSVWDDTTDNYDGGTTYPYYGEDWLTFYKHNALITGEMGHAGFNEIDCMKLNNGGGYEKTFVAFIPGWNMDVDGLITVCSTPQNILDSISQYGLIDAIIEFNAHVVHDNGAILYDLTLSGGIYIDTGTGNIVASRTLGGAFDNVNFNDNTVVPRGKIKIKYKPAI